MKCMRCGAENDDSKMFCETCGAELYTGDNLEPLNIESKKNEQSKGSSDIKDTKKKLNLKRKISKAEKDGNITEIKKSEPKKETSADRIERIKRTAKICFTVALLTAAAAVIIILVGQYGSKKGERIALNVPLGRNIDFCMKTTGEEFSASTKYKDLKSVSGFDYVCESDKTVNISGITVPQWAVLVSQDSSEVLDTVEYYNFSALKGGWKGEHSAIRFTKDTVEYGMDEKTVTKTIGFAPYYTKKTADNKSVSCYRYYIIDNETGSERVFNYYVEFNDVNSTVVNAYDTEINYVNYVLGIK